MNLRVFNVYYPIRNIAFFTIEAVLIFFSILIASVLKIHILDGLPFFWGETLPKIALVTLVCLLSLYYHDLYNFEQISDSNLLIIRLLQTLGVACIALALIYIIFPTLVIAERVSMLALILIIALLISWRLLYNWALKEKRLTEKVLMLGGTAFANTIVDEIDRRQDTGFQVVGVLSDTNTSIPPNNGIPILGEIADVQKVAERASCDRIVVALAERRGQLPLHELLDLKLKGGQINDGVKFYEHLTGKIMVERLQPSYLIFSDDLKLNGIRLKSKRLTDIFFSLLGLVLFLPISILTAIAIKLESKGPILYKQERVGKGGELFILYKFRSMYVDAERGNPVWADVNDRRVTRVGRFIRKTRFDEIPQLINVLKGNMSFVGPRPERPYFVDQLKEIIPYYMQRHVIKPGMTGWALIKFGYGGSVEDAIEKLKYDLYYIKNMSLLFDLAIVFETTKLILLQKGAR